MPGEGRPTLDELTLARVSAACKQKITVARRKRVLYISGMPRPKQPKRRIGVLLSEQEGVALEARAEHEQVTLTDIIRRALRAYIEKHTAQ